uniref:Uncharacterized protein n=1 Tax=Rhizophora mucronata TaxID=61149 RepID=A0A2P2PML6_RHIMU
MESTSYLWCHILSLSYGCNTCTSRDNVGNVAYPSDGIQLGPSRAVRSIHAARRGSGRRFGGDVGDRARFRGDRR